MDLLDKNNLQHVDDTMNGVRKIILIFGTQVYASDKEEEQFVEERVIVAVRRLHEAISDKLDNLVADYVITHGRQPSDNSECSS